MISAQTIEAFWNAVEHAKPLSVGLNCSLGPDSMYPFLEELAEKSSAAISCYPNAGLPNPLSATGFDLGPADMARYLGEFAEGGLINIAGGCCGNTPEHIAAIAKALEGKHPRELREGFSGGGIHSGRTREQGTGNREQKNLPTAIPPFVKNVKDRAPGFSGGEFILSHPSQKTRWMGHRELVRRMRNPEWMRR